MLQQGELSTKSSINLLAYIEKLLSEISTSSDNSELCKVILLEVITYDPALYNSIPAITRLLIDNIDDVNHCSPEHSGKSLLFLAGKYQAVHAIKLLELAGAKLVGDQQSRAEFSIGQLGAGREISMGRKWHICLFHHCQI